MDFADVEGPFSLLNNIILKRNPHLIVVKSISKSYGVPGLRLGILASGDTYIISRLKKQVSIWNINSFGEFYMQIFEKYKKEYFTACKKFIKERERFYSELKQIPYLHVFPSQANFFLCQLTDRFTSHELACKLINKNILIKDCSAKRALEGKKLIRISVRDEKDNCVLIKQLKEL